MKKNFKNLLALVLTGAMLTAGTSVFAAPDEWTGDTAQNTGINSGAGDTVVIGGTDKIRVVLPVDGTLANFVLDTAGVFSMADGDIEFEKGASMYFVSETEDDGSVTAMGKKSAPMYFTNKGLKPVNIKVTVAGQANNSNISVVAADKLDGTKAQLALAAGLVNQTGKELAPETAVDATSGAVLKGVIEDSSGLYELTQNTGGGNSWQFDYSTDADEEEFSKTGVYFTGEADVSYDWDAGMAVTDSTKVDPSKFAITTAYELATAQTKVVKLDDANVESKGVDLALDGVKKPGTKDAGTTSISVKFMQANSNDVAGTTVDMPLSALQGAVEVTGDGKINVKKAGWQTLFDTAGGTAGDIVKVLISAPGAYGQVVEIR